MHAHNVPQAAHVESYIGRNGDGRSTVETTPCCTSAYHVHGSVSKVNRSGADAQVVSCHGYLASLFCGAVNHLLYLWTCFGVVFYSPSPQPRRNLHCNRDIMSIMYQTGT